MVELNNIKVLAFDVFGTVDWHGSIVWEVEGLNLKYSEKIATWIFEQHSALQVNVGVN